MIKENKKILITTIPFLLAIAGQFSSIQQILGINGSYQLGLYFLLIVTSIPLIVLLYNLAYKRLSPFPKDISYNNFMQLHYEKAKVVEIIASGAEQFRNFLETFSELVETNRALEIKLYVRKRNNSTVLRDNIKRLLDISVKSKIHVRIFELEWNAMNISAIIIDNNYAALNFYIMSGDHVYRTWTEYKYICRNNLRTNIELFRLIDRWKSETAIQYTEIDINKFLYAK